MPVSNDITLSINGQTFAGWERLSFTRSIDHMSSTFQLEVNDRWDPKNPPWLIAPYNACVLKIGADVVMTGYVDTVSPELDRGRHRIAVQGRSKTEDLIDCTPDVAGGQFNGYALDAIARAICAPFGIDVVVNTSVGAPFPDATIMRHETAYRFLERLARLRGVLLTDDVNGNLVIGSVSGTRATTQLREGLNILRIAPRLTALNRFSIYKVKTQSGTQTPAPGPAVNRIDAPTPPAVGTASVASQRAATMAYHEANDPVQTPGITVVAGVAYDTNVPRFRPHVIMAESALDAAGAAARAKWEAAFAFGRSVHVQVDVEGWRQNDGTLWATNLLASTISPTMQLDAELLIATATYILGTEGQITRLGLGPVEGYTPDPGQVKARKPRGAGASTYSTAVNHI